MARTGRSTTAVLTALAAVLTIVVGTTVATGWLRADGDVSGNDRSAAVAAAGSATQPAVGDSIMMLTPPPAAARDPVVAARAGELVARGDDLTVERVDLGAVTTVDVAGAARQVTFVYRVVAAAGPYQLRAMPAVLSVDGVALGVAAESEDLESLVLYTYDDIVAAAGGTIALTYGLPGTAAVQWSTTIEAPT